MCLMPPRTRPRLTRPHFGPGGQAQNGGTWAVRAVRGKFEGGKVISASRSRSCTTPPPWFGPLLGRNCRSSRRPVRAPSYILCRVLSDVFPATPWRRPGASAPTFPSKQRYAHGQAILRQPAAASKEGGVERAGVRGKGNPKADSGRLRSRTGSGRGGGERARRTGGQQDRKTGRQGDKAVQHHSAWPFTATDSSNGRRTRLSDVCVMCVALLRVPLSRRGSQSVRNLAHNAKTEAVSRSVGSKDDADKHTASHVLKKENWEAPRAGRTRTTRTGRCRPSSHGVLSGRTWRHAHAVSPSTWARCTKKKVHVFSRLLVVSRALPRLSEKAVSAAIVRGLQIRDGVGKESRCGPICGRFSLQLLFFLLFFSSFFFLVLLYFLLPFLVSRLLLPAATWSFSISCSSSWGLLRPCPSSSLSLFHPNFSLPPQSEAKGLAWDADGTVGTRRERGRPALSSVAGLPRSFPSLFLVVSADVFASTVHGMPKSWLAIAHRGVLNVSACSARNTADMAPWSNFEIGRWGEMRTVLSL